MGKVVSAAAPASPAVGAITGLGTGVATALAVNVGSAGAPALTGGAGSFTTLAASSTLSGNLTPPVYDRFVRTAGSITTTSTTLVDLTGATVTFTTGARPVHVSFTGGWANSGVAGANTINVDIDAALQFGTIGIRQEAMIAGQAALVNINFDTAALTAAAHTIKIQWAVGADTGTMLGTTALAFIFSAHEIR